MRLSLLVALAFLVACSTAEDKHQPDAAVTGCSSAADCDDGDACTTDTCSATRMCEHAAKTIDDSIDCTTDACNAATGEVTHTPVNTMCEQDGKSCTVATCSATTGCAHTLNDNACSDAFSCTTNTCTPTAVAADATTGCLVVPNNNSCGDSINCTADTCNPTGAGHDAAGCVHQTMNNLCEVDGKSCTVATCSATTGCTETPTNAMCNDNATCSTDTCSPTGPGATGCSHTLNNAMCTDTAECSTDACSPGTGGADTTTGCLHTANASACSANAACGATFDCVCNGGYSGDGLTCTGIACDALTDPVNGFVDTTNGNNYPSTATYACDPGFGPVGSATRTCGTDGHWSGTAPTCDPTFYVVRVGDGTAALSSTSAAVFLEERTSAGTIMRTLSLPTAASGANAPFTLSGTANTEGGLARSADGGFVTLAGYATAPGKANVSTTPNVSTDATSVNRVVARVSLDGLVDTSTVLPNAFNASSVRGACTDDGTTFWVTGTSSAAATGGVQYTTLGSTSNPTQISSTVTNLRNVAIFDDQLYASTAAGTRGVFTIGSGLPTTTGQVAVQIASSSPTSASPQSFAIVDVNGDGDLDTMYVTQDSGTLAGKVNLQKWTYNGTIWSQVTAFGATAGTTTPTTAGLTTWLDSTGKVHIIVTTGESPSRILHIVDDGVNTAPAATVIGTAGTNTVFRGVARSPTL